MFQGGYHRLGRALITMILVASVAAEAAAKKKAEPVSEELPPVPEFQVNAVVQHRVTLDGLGFDVKERRFSESDTRSMIVRPRTGSVTLDAQLRLDFRTASARQMMASALEVLVDGILVKSIGSESFIDGVSVDIPLGLHFVGPEHQFTLRLVGANEDTCGAVPAGSWLFLDGGQFTFELAELPHTPDLADLPLPFVDVDFDEEPVIPIAVLADASIDAVEMSADVAAWFGIQVPNEIRFEPMFGSLPSGRGIVLSTNLGAERAGLPHVEGASIQWVVHPDDPKTYLLMIAGPTESELEQAVRHFLAAGDELVGGQVSVDPMAQRGTESRAASRATKLSDSDELSVMFHDLKGLGPLELEGATGSLKLDFRLPSDLDLSGHGYLLLTLDMSTLSPSGADTRELVIELNDNFVGRLPLKDADAGRLIKRVKVPPSYMRGLNELELHLKADSARRCDEGSEGWGFELHEGSGLVVGDIEQVTWLPNLRLFVEDGFPFTRQADLSQSVIVLPERPSPEVSATVLSLVAHMARVTRKGPIGARWMSAGELVKTRPDADILVVGTPEQMPILADWSEYSPLIASERGFRARPPSTEQIVNGLLEGRRIDVEAARAHEAMSLSGSRSVVYGFESLWTPHRSVVVVSASDQASLPLISDLRGEVSNGADQGDILVAQENFRWLVAVGDRYNSASLSSWSALLRFLGRYWTLTLPLLLFGAICFGFAARRSMMSREEARLRLGGGLHI